MTGWRRRAAALIWPTLGIAALLMVWALVHHAYGALVMPSLADTAAAFQRIAVSGALINALSSTLLHAVGGVLLGIAVGFALGLAGGLIVPLGAALAPIASIILAIPPIVWVVLSFLWFGVGGLGALITVAITTMPVIFAATLQGIRARDPLLAEMATVFRLPWRSRLFRITLPGLATVLAPALTTAIAISWKVALTAEVLGDGSGIGGRFAEARAHLDLAEAMAWIALVACLVLVVDQISLGSLRRWLLRAQPASPSALIEQPARCAAPPAATERRC
ncbi:ABC transporter permease subunit [Rhodopseudomonas pseudopalustris]|uniref:ABC transporter permease n=1 Tax=Rhodopseudomonas pseudopalustris TaxID=1513892 RepID=UPI003F9BD26E